MKKARLWIVPVMAVIALMMTFGRAWAESTVRVSVDSNGAQVNDGSTTPAVSQTGRYVTFQSGDGNLVAGDTNGLTDIFVHDRDADEDGTYDEAADIATVRVNVDLGRGTGFQRQQLRAGHLRQRPIRRLSVERQRPGRRRHEWPDGHLRP